MKNWLDKLFGRWRRVQGSAPAHHEVPAPARTVAHTADVRKAESSLPPVQGLLSNEQLEFIYGLIEPPDSRPISDWAGNDRKFLGGIQKRWHARQLELPVLPAAAIRLAEVLRNSEAPVSQLVDLIEGDAALSVEVIKCANSAGLARGPAVRSIHEAVMRIGLRRLGSVLVMAHLTTKILKGGEVQNYAALLMDMVPPLGYLSGLLSKTADAEDGLSFIRGALLHVEHMVILGIVPAVSRDHRQPIKPSVAALLQAIHHFGPEIRDAVGIAWDMRSVLAAPPTVMAEYYGFRRAVVMRWLGEPLPLLPEIDASRLHVVMSHVRPRVANAA